MPIILAIDVGTKRVGVAVSDPHQTIASPHKTFNRAQGKAEKEIIKLVTDLEIVTVVVGLPLNQNGDKTIQCEDIERFCRRLQRRVNIQIEFVDEHLSSIEAEERLRASNSNRQIEKGRIDAAAAAIILEDYLKLKR